MPIVLAGGQRSVAERLPASAIGFTGPELTAPANSSRSEKLIYSRIVCSVNTFFFVISIPFFHLFTFKRYVTHPPFPFCY